MGVVFLQHSVIGAVGNGQRGEPKVGFDLVGDPLTKCDRVACGLARLIAIGKRPCVSPVAECELAGIPDPIQRGR